MIISILAQVFLSNIQNDDNVEGEKHKCLYLTFKMTIMLKVKPFDDLQYLCFD